MTKVTTGRQTETVTVITAGLVPPADVVTTGFTRLTDGAKISVSRPAQAGDRPAQAGDRPAQAGDRPPKRATGPPSGRQARPSGRTGPPKRAAPRPARATPSPQRRATTEPPAPKTTQRRRTIAAAAATTAAPKPERRTDATQRSPFSCRRGDRAARRSETATRTECGAAQTFRWRLIGQDGPSVNISAPFILRPIATALLAVAVLLAGLMGLPAAVGLLSAAGGFPDHPGLDAIAGRQPGHDLVASHGLSGAAVRSDSGPCQHVVAEFVRAEPDHAAVQSRPRHRRRSPGRSVGHQCRGLDPAP